MAPLVEVRGLRKAFGSQEVLRGVNLQVHPGNVLAIIGPSGCGKSTLLRCLNFLEMPTAGEIVFGGQRVEDQPAALQALRARVGMVFQRFHLFPHLTVLQNLCLAPRVVRGETPAVATPRAQDLLEKVGMGGFRDAWPDQLSGGQQQRVAIARCLMMQPELLLFDEPTSALDPELVGEVLAVIRSLVEEGRTMCIVTHEMGFARDVASGVVMIDQGVVLEQGPPAQVLEAPAEPRTRQFLQRVLHRGR